MTQNLVDHRLPSLGFDDSTSTVHYNAALVEDRLGDSGGSALNTRRSQFKDIFNGNGDFTIEFVIKFLFCRW